MALLTKGWKSRKRALPATLPPFEHAEAQSLRDLPPRARRLARRWGLAPAVARNIAGLADYPWERD